MWFTHKNELIRHLVHGYMIQTKEIEFRSILNQLNNDYFCGNDSPYHKGFIWWNNKNELMIKLNNKWQKFKVEKYKVKIEKNSEKKWQIKTRKKIIKN